MKHLKSYKIFESIDIINDIRDILKELEDIGYSTYVQWTPLTIAGYPRKKEIMIQINKMKKKSFIGSEEDLETIILTFEHLESFLSDSKFKIKSFFFDNSSYNILTNSITEGKSFREIFTNFYKEYKDSHSYFILPESLGDIGDYIQLILVEK